MEVVLDWDFDFEVVPGCSPIHRDRDPGSAAPLELANLDECIFLACAEALCIHLHMACVSRTASVQPLPVAVRVRSSV